MNEKNAAPRRAVKLNAETLRALEAPSPVHPNALTTPVTDCACTGSGCPSSHNCPQ